ncbi:MAG: hypothetical protein WBP08_14670 [Saprospiraceae bacterium]
MVKVLTFFKHFTIVSLSFSTFGIVISVHLTSIVLLLMQNKVYSRYIYQMLMEHSHVAVPEMGTFHLQYDQAYFDNNHEILYPPKTKVYFSPAVDPDYILSNLLSVDGISERDSEFIENLVVNDFAATVKKGIPFEFDGLGTISNNIFIEKDKETFNRYTGLKDLSVKVVQKGNFKLDDNFVHYLNKPKNQVVEDRFTDLILPGLLALMVSVIIAFWVFTRENIPGHETEQIQQVKPIDNVRYSDTMYNAIDSGIETRDNKDTITQNQEIEGESNKPSTKSIVRKLTKPEAPFINESEDTMVKSITDSDILCVIIVGTFINISNADNMSKKITDMGYSSFQQNYHGMTRVGIRYDCGKNDPESYKMKIRKIFNQDAWHLHDTIKN